MSSLNKGLSEYINPTPQTAPVVKKSHETFLGHVLEVVTDSESDLYDGIESIGLIKVNLIPTNYDKPESNAKVLAYPMDRGNYILPLAGQQVWGMIGLAPDATQRYYYGGVISTEQTSTATIIPFLGAAPSSLKQDGYPTPAVAAKRFDERNGYQRESLAKGKSLEKFREGDKIIEGQFGGVIKFTHTITKPGVWNTAAQITNINNPNQLPSKDGDPMLIIKAEKKNPGLTFEDSDINVDDCNIYLTTTQNVPMELNCSTKLQSYTYTPDIPSEIGTTIDEESSSIAKFFGGGFDPNAKIKVKIEGSIEYTGGGSTIASPTADQAGNTAITSTQAPIKDGIVVFVSGYTDNKSHASQTADFQSSFGNKYTIQSYNFRDKNSIVDFATKNEAKIAAIVLYSAGGQLIQSLPSFPAAKIYIVEAYNSTGKEERSGWYTKVPAGNMYLHATIVARGKGLKAGANTTPAGLDHFEALKDAAKKIAARV